MQTKLAPFNSIPRSYTYITYLLLSSFSSQKEKSYYLNMGKLYYYPNSNYNGLKTLYSLHENDVNTCISILESYHSTKNTTVPFLPYERLNVGICYIQMKYYSTAYKLLQQLSHDLDCNTTSTTFSIMNDWIVSPSLEMNYNYKLFLCSHVYNNLAIALELFINDEYHHSNATVLYELVMQEYRNSLKYNSGNEDASKNYNDLLSLIEEDDSMAKDEKDKIGYNEDVTINDTTDSELDVENQNNVTPINDSIGDVKTTIEASKLDSVAESDEIKDDAVNTAIQAMIKALEEDVRNSPNSYDVKDIYLSYKLFQMKLYM